MESLKKGLSRRLNGGTTPSTLLISLPSCFDRPILTVPFSYCCLYLKIKRVLRKWQWRRRRRRKEEEVSSEEDLIKRSRNYNFARRCCCDNKVLRYTRDGTRASSTGWPIIANKVRETTLLKIGRKLILLSLKLEAFRKKFKH